MLRQMTDIVPDKIPYGVLLCVLAVLFLFFPSCVVAAGVVNAPVSGVTAITGARLSVCWHNCRRCRRAVQA